MALVFFGFLGLLVSENETCFTLNVYILASSSHILQLTSKLKAAGGSSKTFHIIPRTGALGETNLYIPPLQVGELHLNLCLSNT